MVGTDSWSPTLRLSTRKSEYSVQEAARVLGVSFDELRSLLIRHVLDEMDAIENIPKMRFKPADLVMLSLVAHGPDEPVSAID